MKKRTRRILTVLGAMAGMAVLAIIYLGFSFQSELKSMSPLESGPLREGVYSVKTDMVNFYLVRGPGGLVAFDAGSDAASAARELKQLGVDPLEVKAVLLTHSDYDHVGALPLFRNAVLYLSRDEVRMIDGSTDRMLFLKNKIGSAYKTLADGQELEAAGLKVKCLASPGHTPGSMCYLVDQAWLFTGDTIALNEGRAGTFIKFFNMDGEAQRQAIPKLAGLSGVRAVFTAHHGMSDDYARVFAGWKN